MGQVEFERLKKGINIVLDEISKWCYGIIKLLWNY